MTEQLKRARQLRKHMTPTERLVWSKLRNRRFAQFKFRRQVPWGPYIVDFVCYERRLIVELDGGGHNDSSARAYDARRTRWLEEQGFGVLRFWNHEVLEEGDAVEEALWRELQKAPSPPTPLPQRGEGRT
jgi:adenine-specific DNA-methyltransferase